MQVFSSSLFPQCPLRMELIWFCPMLKDETMPKPAAKEYFMVLFYKHGHEGARKHLSIVSHAKVIIIINNLFILESLLFLLVIQKLLE